MCLDEAAAWRLAPSTAAIGKGGPGCPERSKTPSLRGAMPSGGARSGRRHRHVQREALEMRTASAQDALKREFVDSRRKAGSRESKRLQPANHRPRLSASVALIGTADGAPVWRLRWA